MRERKKEREKKRFYRSEKILLKFINYMFSFRFVSILF